MYENYATQSLAAKKLATTPCYLGHVLNGRRAMTPKMLRVMGLEKEVLVRYKKLPEKIPKKTKKVKRKSGK